MGLTHLEIDREEPLRPLNAVIIEMKDDGRFTITVQVKEDDKAVIEKLQQVARALVRSSLFEVEA